jgi:hypothetical protein
VLKTPKAAPEQLQITPTLIGAAAVVVWLDEVEPGALGDEEAPPLEEHAAAASTRAQAKTTSICLRATLATSLLTEEQRDSLLD